jgi:uncharacterized protein YndB with AHSA1/START domain
MNNPVVVEEIFESNKKLIWKAITELEQMKWWFFDKIPAFEPKVGFEVAFNIKSGGQDFIHQWKIIEVLPEEKIVYDWKYENFKGCAFLSFDLFEENNKTNLKVTCEGIESFPQEIPEFTRESCLAGWNYFIKERLKIFINTK